MPTYALLAIVVALAVGWYLFQTRSGTADGAYDAFALFSSIIWILSGVFLILGGFYLIGGVVLALFFWIALSKGEKTSERLRARLSS